MKSRSMLRRPLVTALLVTLVTAASADAQSTPLTINYQTGRVGVSTTAPAYTLDVNGTVNATTFRGDGSQLTNLPLPPAQWTTSGSTISNANAGSVGIGTTAPAYTLDVSGTVNATGFRGDGSQLTNLPTAGPWSLGTGEIHYTGGNVGIATSTPKETLHVGPVLGLRSFSAGNFSNLGNNLYLSGGDYRAIQNGGISLIQLVDNLMMFYVGPYNNAGAVISGATERMRIDAGGVQVTGTMTATTKNFQIPHPKRPATNELVHSSLEGPEIAVYYRGEAALVNGAVEIDLPDYFEALTRQNGRTVQLTARDGWSPLFVDGTVDQGRFTVRTNRQGDPTQRFYWEVKAVRADVAPLEPEPMVAEATRVRLPKKERP